MLTTATSNDPAGRPLAWTAALGATACVICVIGIFAPPIEKKHYKADQHEAEARYEVFVPPATPPPEVASPKPSTEPVAEIPIVATAPSLAATTTDTVSALVISVVPAIKGLSRLAVPPTLRAQSFMRSNDSGRFPEPPYPRWARQQGLQGKLTLRVEVSPSGAISELQLKETSGHDLLDRHVLEWVRAHWSWQPANQRLYLIPFVFELQ